MLTGSAQPRTWGPMTTTPTIRTTTCGTRSRASKPTTRGASAATRATTKRLLSAWLRSSADIGVSPARAPSGPAVDWGAAAPGPPVAAFGPARRPSVRHRAADVDLPQEQPRDQDD